MAKAVYWKFWKSTRAKVLWTGQLSQSDPSMVKVQVQVRSHNLCVGVGGGVCGRENQEVRWLGQRGTYQSPSKYRTETRDKEGHIRVYLNIEQQNNSPIQQKKWQILDQEVYEFGTRLSFLQMFWGSAPVPHLNKILQLPSAKKNNTTHKYLLLLYSGKIHHQISPGKAAVEKTGQRVQKRRPLKACRRSLQTRPTASERVKPRYMTPYNLNKNKIKNTN